MILRHIRRLRFALLPIYAIALAGLQGRLTWAHDPSCPHHQGQAQHRSAPSAGSHAGHAMTASHASHATASTAVHETSPAKHGPEVPCQCVDPTCSIAGVVALAAAPAATDIAVDLYAFAEAPRLAPTTITAPGCYTSHRLPFPLAPPRHGLSS